MHILFLWIVFNVYISCKFTLTYKIITYWVIIYKLLKFANFLTQAWWSRMSNRFRNLKLGRTFNLNTNRLAPLNLEVATTSGESILKNSDRRASQQVCFHVIWIIVSIRIFYKYRVVSHAKYFFNSHLKKKVSKATRQCRWTVAWIRLLCPMTHSCWRPGRAPPSTLLLVHCL